MFILKLSLLLLAITIGVNSSHAPRGVRRYQCPNINGIPLVLCSSTFRNWCAYFSGGDCDSKICQKQTSNDCTACLDPNVQYYTKRKCTDRKIYCDSYAPENCPRNIDYVCGYYTEDCPYEICSRTVSNSCEACKNGFKYFTKGKCRNPTDLSCRNRRCGPNSPLVCGFFKEGCPFGICQQTYINECEACQDPKVLFHREGFCENETFSCDNIDLPEVCPTGYSPTCASRRSDGHPTTFDNVCFACSAGGYSLFKNGVCLEDRATCGDRSEPSECPGAADAPVCAFFDDPCPDGLCFATAGDGCYACSDRSVDYYIEGACKATFDNREYCLPNNRPEGCPDNWDPVCAFKDIVCVTEPCPNTETVSNGCTACQDPAVAYHTPGPCPDDAADST